jgi:Ca2+-binding RTX toxin-like protein
MSHITSAVSYGTVSGSALFDDQYYQTISGAITLTISHDSFGYHGEMTIVGSGSESGWNVPEYNWSGPAGTDPDYPGFAFTDGNVLTFSATAYRNSDIDNYGLNYVHVEVQVTIGSGPSITPNGAWISFGSDDSPISLSLGPLAVLIPGTDGDDNLEGSDDADVIDAGAGNDFISAGAGDDTVLGGAGLDTILAGDGNDSVDAGPGSDRVEGGNGDDTLYADSGNDVVLGGNGKDELVGGSGKGDDKYTGGAGVDTLRYSSANNAVTANLGTGRASGTDIGNDTIASVENLIGGKGADKLFGDAGANVINGMGGNDTIRGGAGHDKLTGGAGADKFIFGEAPISANTDTVSGFVSGIDKIQIDDVAFSSLRVLGTLTTTAFSKYFDYSTSDGKLYYDPDGPTGGAAHQLIATFSGAPNLVASDFVVI